MWRTARRLHEALAGAVLRGSDLRVPALATRDLSGRRTIEVVPRGKHLLHRVEGGITLHSHLRMDGSWRIAPASARPAAGRRHTVRALLWTDRHVAVGDQLGMLDLVRTDDEATLVGHLGPDLLDPGFDGDLALANLRREPDRPVAEALLDQRNLCGIGTIFASEPLFEHGVDPWALVGELPDEVLATVVGTARARMVHSARVGFTVTTGRSDRRPEAWVFGRKGQPCRRCGTVIDQGTVGEPPRQRVLSYCPVCQRGGRMSGS
ncbi:Fpg/Nei family DNA glycosylase [Ornithinicoccus hortensis]